MDQELVTRFTADISQYKKSMASLQAELKQLSGVTDKIKTVTARQCLPPLLIQGRWESRWIRLLRARSAMCRPL